MNDSGQWILILLLVGCALIAGCAQPAPQENANEGAYRTVVDSRGIEVRVPVQVERVVTIDDGTILEVMTVLGKEETLVGVGSRTFQEVDKYTFPTMEGGEYSFANGMNTMTFLHPWVQGVPVIAEFDGGVNYEAIANLKPDVLIVELGSCTFWTNDEQVQRSVDRIESLQIPLVVLKGTDFYEEPNISALWDEVRIVGEVFGEEEKAQATIAYLESQIDLVRNRTADVPEEEKPLVMYLGLAYVARDEGGAGNTVSTNSFESWAIEHLVHARSAARTMNLDYGYWHIVNAEQILKADPDVIILPTDWGYHPVRELYEAPYYRNLQQLTAVKNRHVASLPWTPYDCAKRLEYPIEVMVMAKTSYPERFQDIDLNSWILDFYQELYGIDRSTAEGLRSAQWMDWVLLEGG